ncbi:hypothetical protein JZX76_00825 [Haloarcula hispanica]|uniref:Uncharacterized protein n=2 Tax=Haloarculaceae TaxID=1963268 RepID=A0A482TDF0_HALHI|nr:hypothetical protein [Haloarcula hispanica]MCJ0618124.1 hypothetical protein [Haloarcula hispanica]RYJ15640.1 hypothetical protein ELS20_00855 [Haloarcula hispanica]
MEQLVLVANEVGMEGPRLGELLGLPRDEDRVNGDYHLSDDEVVELHEMSEELLSRIESSLKIDGDIVEAATDIHPREYSSVEASEVVYLRVYHKFWMVRDLLDFAIEQDLDIYVG